MSTTPLELLLYSTGGTSYGPVTLYGNEPININMAIGNISQITEKKSPHTQSFVLPGDTQNNKLFNHIYQINSDSLFDTRVKVPAALVYNSNTVLSNSYLQLTDISVDKNKDIRYMVSLVGESQDLFSKIGDALLTDLDWSDLDHFATYSAITNSWTASTYPDYFYPLIDYGFSFNLADMAQVGVTYASTYPVGTIFRGVTIDKMFPATNLKLIVDKIAAYANKRINSSFLNDVHFKNLYIPFNGDIYDINTDAFVEGLSFRAQMTGTSAQTEVIGIPGSGGGPITPTYHIVSPGFVINNNDDTSFPNFDNGSNYDISTFTYIGSGNSAQQFFQNLVYSLEFAPGSNLQVFGGLVVEFWRVSSLIFQPYSTHYIPVDISSSSSGVTLLSTQVLDGHITATNRPVQDNEQFYVKIHFDADVRNLNVGSTSISLKVYPQDPGRITDTTYYYNKVFKTLVSGQYIDYSRMIPRNIKMRDILDGITKMYNLVYDSTQKDSIDIEPYEDYYNNGEISIWTDKVDKNYPITEQLTSELQNREFKFTYTPDVDYYNQHYTDLTKEVYTEKLIDTGNQYLDGQKLVQPIFSPTPSVAIRQAANTNTFVDEFVIPNISAKEDDGFGKTKSNIRVLQRNPDGLIPLSFQNRWRLDGQIQRQLPYLGMLNHPGSGNTSDIGFDTTQFVYYSLSSITSNNLYTLYWKTFIEKICDKDSKLITARFKLTPSDIEKFKFNDIIFIEGLTDEGGNYFIVESIDYSPTSNEPATVKLLKFKKKFNTDLNLKSGIKTMDSRKKDQTSIEMGGGASYSVASIAMGEGSVINERSNSSLVMGYDSTIMGGCINSTIFGNNSLITNSFGATIFGSNSSISGASGSFVFGDNITATTSDTLFTNNIIISSGSSINGIIFSALTASTFLWTASTGSNSIIANNNESNQANGDLSFAIGSANTVYTTTSAAIGYSNLISGETLSGFAYPGFAIGGRNTVYGRNSLMTGYENYTFGNENLGYGAFNNSLGNQNLIGGFNCILSGNQSFIGGTNCILSGDNSIVFGNNSKSIGNNIFVLGENLTGTTSNTTYVDNLVVCGTTLSNPYVARVYIPNDQNITSNGYTKITLSAETFDPSGSWNSTTTQYVTPATGYYQINSCIIVTNTTTAGNGFGPLIYINGAFSGSNPINTIVNSGEFYSATLSDIYFLNAGDVVELYCIRFGPAVTTMVVIGGGTTSTNSYLSITKL